MKVGDTLPWWRLAFTCHKWQESRRVSWRNSTSLNTLTTRVPGKSGAHCQKLSPSSIFADTVIVRARNVYLYNHVWSSAYLSRIRLHFLSFGRRLTYMYIHVHVPLETGGRWLVWCWRFYPTSDAGGRGSRWDLGMKQMLRTIHTLPKQTASVRSRLP